MRPAEVTADVWSGLLALSAGQPAAPDPAWSAAERAAWDLYVPLAAGSPEPFLFAQVGQSLDGRIATVSGDAADVSGEAGLCHLHRCRALAQAVVVGVRTALLDNPRLTIRLVPGPAPDRTGTPGPARVVIDPRGRLPDDARVLAEDGARRLVIQGVPRDRPPGVEVIRLPMAEGWIPPAAIREALTARGLTRVLIEGGGVTIAGFLEAGLLNRLHVGISPIIIGAGPSGLHTAPIARLADALRPQTHVYGLGAEVMFDCALAPAGSASRSTCPTKQAEPPLAARRA